MFTFSFHCLEQLAKRKLDLHAVTTLLGLQGFEVQAVEQKQYDHAITIEVKANRPDCLSHLGVLREVNAYDDVKQDLTLTNSISSSLNDSHIPIQIEDTSSCTRFCALILNELDNTHELPSEIKQVLTSLEIESINSIVDLLNYAMVVTGQPFHAYDLDKLSQDPIVVIKTQKPTSLKTLNGSTVEAPKDTILITQNHKPLAIAGIIGGSDSAVSKNTKRILIESANFNPVLVRIASKKLKISTDSSFRFERGVNVDSAKTYLDYAASLIKQHCGGHEIESVDVYPCARKANVITISIARVNDLLGLALSPTQMEKFLHQYHCQTKLIHDTHIEVTTPLFRLDLTEEIDLIEEIARAYGYHNIKPTMPRITPRYNKNKLVTTRRELKTIFIGLGFYEVVNYSFIPSQSLQHLGLTTKDRHYSDVLLQNPLTQDHDLMRPTLMYGLMNNVAYNYSLGNKNTALFELGRRYLRDTKTDTGFIEPDAFAAIFTGNRMERGFQINQDITYSFYDLLNYLAIIFNQFNIAYKLVPAQYPFFQTGVAFDIIIDDQIKGFCGQIADSTVKSIENGKLIRSELFYLEFDIQHLHKERKYIEHYSKFPPITREYNFLCDNTIAVNDICNCINAVSNIISEVNLKDVYHGKGVPEGKKSLLLEVRYVSFEKTLTTEEVAQLEAQFLAALAKLGVHFK